MLIGHDQAKSILRQLKSHTLLFTGPEGVGRRQAARWFAALQNCEQANPDLLEPCLRCNSCLLLEANEHPDYKEVSADLNTSTGRLNRRPEIRISQLVPRKDSQEDPLSTWLESRAVYRRRVAVIDSAQLLNISAANAFLKTLEEPPPKTSIILIAPSAQAILPTIASRSSQIRFSPSKDLGQDFALASLGRRGDLVTQDKQVELNECIELFIKALPKTLEEAFEAADALEKQWESSASNSDLVLAQLSKLEPHVFEGASKALIRLEEALSSYSSSHLAMQVFTLELRSLLNN